MHLQSFQNNHSPRLNPLKLNVAILISLLIVFTLPAAAQATSDTSPETAPVSTTNKVPTSTEPSDDNIEPDLNSMQRGLGLLLGKSFKDKIKAVKLIASSGDSSALHYLKALLEANLYYRKSNKEIIIAKRNGNQYLISNPANNAYLGMIKKSDIKKIKINNAIRRLLREKIAGLSLKNPDPAVRLAAIDEMISSHTEGLYSTLKASIDDETDSKVRDLMQTGISLGELDSHEIDIKLNAINSLSGNLNPAVRNRLISLKNDESQDARVKKTSQKALASIDGRIEIYHWVETLFFGLSLGSVLVLAAIGLAITFGVMGVINMAHGELIMLGAYTTYLIQQLVPGYTGWSLLVSIPAAFVVAGLAGILIERSIIQFLYGRPLETLLATFGVSLILQQLVRTLISPQNVPVSNPDWMSGSLQVNPVLSLTYNRLYIFVFCLLVFAVLYVILKKTRLGLQVRAVSQNRAMARAMGVRSGRIDALTFGLGAGIAGVAGVALSQLTNVGPNLGQAYIIDSFMVVVFGGVGNLMGTLVAGLFLGVANKVLEPWAGAVLAKILVLIFIILFIQKRPRGLFPQKGRAAEN